MPGFQDPHGQKILILDFGAQYTQLIGRRIRELGVYCEIFPYHADAEEIRRFAPRGVILSGSHASVRQDSDARIPDIIFESGWPMLGICYGMQTLVNQLGGSVEIAERHEYGQAAVNICKSSRLCGPVAQELSVWMSHGDQVTRLPDGFDVVGRTATCPFAAIADESRSYYGVQFHPEVTHTTAGRSMLSRFVHQICGCGSDWVPANIIESQVRWIRDQVGEDEVILGLSGGVDSSVVAALLNAAIGDQLTCIFIDTGLLRQGEGDQVMQTFSDFMGVRALRVDAGEEFLDRLKGVVDPERKRKVIGNLFVEIFQREASRVGNAKWLAQGTIYPDVIESAGHRRGDQSAQAKVIKSHHNVGGLPADMGLKLLEPLRELFKDEVRRVGTELGLPPQMVNRHPFPGPGLGVRILGEVKAQYVQILRQADAIFLDELRQADLYDKTSQAFAVFLPVKSVGVVGDNRAYEYVIALRAVETTDFMTANWAHLPYPALAKVSNRIINEVRGVSRVTYDISGKPPATIEWE